MSEDDEADEECAQDEDGQVAQNKTPHASSRSSSVIVASTKAPTLALGSDDEMQVDENENEAGGVANAEDDVEPVIQVDTSQTTWGRRLGMNSRKSPSNDVPSPDRVGYTSGTSPSPQALLPLPPSPTSILTSAPALPPASIPTSVVSDRILLRQQQAAARVADAETSRAALKKRKSESGAAIVTAVVARGQPSRNEDTDSEDEQPAPDERDDGADDDNGDGMASPQRKTSSTASASEDGTSAQKLRGRLANFASGRSQIGSQILRDNDPVTMTEENGATGDTLEVQEEDELDEEIDELEDSDTLVEQPRKSRPTAVASSSSSTLRTVARSRKSGEEYISAIDLTSDDEIEASHDRDDDNEKAGYPSQNDEEEHSTLGTTIGSEVPVHHPEVLRVADADGDISVRFDLQRVREVWSRKARAAYQPAPAEPEEDAVAEILADASISNVNDEQRAVNALARVIEKTDFATMDIVGQFNLGFIIVRRRKTEELPEEGASASPTLLDDLFIVDQHAADEKYNFETLQATTKIASQKLFRCAFKSSTGTSI